MALPDDVFEHGPDPENPGWRHWNLKDETLFNGAVMGKLITRVEDEGRHSRLRMYPERKHENLQGIIHGAVTLALIDISLFTTMHTIGSGNAGPSVTLELSTQFTGGGKPDMPLDAVARSMVANPSVNVACVVGEERQLLGLIDIMSLADDLFVHIVPEEFLSEVTDLEEALRYADMSRMRTASDAMKTAIWVKSDETCREAFRRMHDHRLPGLPVVDDNYHVVGYVNLLELLALCSAPVVAQPEAGGPAT